jgi:hypothetical protein
MWKSKVNPRNVRYKTNCQWQRSLWYQWHHYVPCLSLDHIVWSTTCILQRRENMFLYRYPYEYNKHKLSLSVKYVSILLFHHLYLVPPKCLLPFRFPTLRAFPFSPVPRHATCFVSLIIPDFITTITSNEERAHTHTFTDTHTLLQYSESIPRFQLLNPWRWDR